MMTNSIAAADTRPLPNPDLVLEGRFEPGHERRYCHVSFSVPTGINQLHFRYDYSDRIPADPDLSGGNTLDIGLFDARGTHAGGPGFRGWSGSAKREFTVGSTWATPPYKAGPLPAGEWSLLLGPYKVSPNGLEYRIELWFNPRLPTPPLPAPVRPPQRPDLPPPARPRWVRADLHSHTIYSDGDSSPLELLIAAANAGLNVVGVTDHNGAVAPVVTGHNLTDLPLLMPGIEVTTYGGHWNAWSADNWTWHEFRYPSSPAVQQSIDIALERGAFVSVNHPKPFGPPWTYEVERFHAVEVWNGWWQGLNAIALANWESLLRQGQQIVAIGGSDTHYLRQAERRGLPVAKLGHPTTWIEIPDGMDLSVAALLAGLRAGRCFVSASPTGPQLYLDAIHDLSGDDHQALLGPGVRVQVIGAAHQLLSVLGAHGAIFAEAITSNDQAFFIPFPDDSPYVRAQIVDAAGNLLAISNPIWRE